MPHDSCSFQNSTSFSLPILLSNSHFTIFTWSALEFRLLLIYQSFQKYILQTLTELRSTTSRIKIVEAVVFFVDGPFIYFKFYSGEKNSYWRSLKFEDLFESQTWHDYSYSMKKDIFTVLLREKIFTLLKRAGGVSPMSCNRTFCFSTTVLVATTAFYVKNVFANAGKSFKKDPQLEIIASTTKRGPFL